MTGPKPIQEAAAEAMDRVELFAMREATKSVMRACGKMLRVLGDDALTFTEVTWTEVGMHVTTWRESAQLVQQIADRQME